MPTPILFIPGLLCSAEIFAPQIADLWRLAPVSVGWTLGAATIGDVAAQILDAAPPRFALCGISMGGYISFEILRRAPERVVRLALLDTSARPDTPAQTSQRQGMLSAAARGEFATWAQVALTSILHPDHRNDEHLLAINRRMAEAVGLSGFRRQTAIAMSRPDSRADLAAIRVPTLIAVGAEDPLTPPEHSIEMAQAVANSKLVVIPDCGHSATLEQPSLINAALREWIQA